MVIKEMVLLKSKINGGYKTGPVVGALLLLKGCLHRQFCVRFAVKAKDWKLNRCVFLIKYRWLQLHCGSYCGHEITHIIAFQIAHQIATRYRMLCVNGSNSE
jgi:hypothetical protein